MIPTLEGAKIIDITPLLSPRTAVWPGDQRFERKVALNFDSGVNFVLSHITMTTHTGAHADAPSHYHRSGESIEKRPLSLYLGPCEVIACRASTDFRISPQDFLSARAQTPMASLPLAPRVLFKTGTFPNPEYWNTDYHSLSPELIEFLADQGVKLIGIDSPSIDPDTAKVLITHEAVYKRGLAILEGLVLDTVSPKRYELIALPLPLENADASWVRAILIDT
jgi:arylformamidase